MDLNCLRSSRQIKNSGVIDLRIGTAGAFCLISRALSRPPALPRLHAPHELARAALSLAKGYSKRKDATISAASSIGLDTPMLGISSRFGARTYARFVASSRPLSNKCGRRAELAGFLFSCGRPNCIEFLDEFIRIDLRFALRRKGIERYPVPNPSRYRKYSSGSDWDSPISFTMLVASIRH